MFCFLEKNWRKWEPESDTGWFFLYQENLIYEVIFFQVTRLSIFLFQRAPPGFKVNQKLEAVDKRNPSMVRAATVAEVNEYRLRIHFDGWDDIYDDWFEADSLDLYPVGWCEKTGHPFETPLSKCFVSLKISAKSVFKKGDLIGIPMNEVFVMLY